MKENLEAKEEIVEIVRKKAAERTNFASDEDEEIVSEEAIEE